MAGVASNRVGSEILLSQQFGRSGVDLWQGLGT